MFLLSLYQESIFVMFGMVDYNYLVTQWHSLMDFINERNYINCINTADVYVYVCVFTSIPCDDFFCLDQLEYQRADQQCCVEDVYFIRQIPSSLFYIEAANLPN